MNPIMLIEIWERLRGYDKWVEAEATIQTSDLQDVQVADFHDRYGRDYPVDESHSFCNIVWTDSNGTKHCGSYEVSENSALYQLYDGQTIKIRYNPIDPDQFYLRGAMESGLITTLKWKIGPAILLGILFAVWAFGEFLGHLK